ncbi:uncharacterized protein [Mytilus edulis]|uniref:uncharacterized protein n=1 Tax=Mytilus edulis TaxID=6550 RepID=UPI0039F10296
MEYSNYNTEYGSAIPPSKDTPVKEQPQAKYGFSQQPGQPQGVVVIPPTLLITPAHFEPYETKCPHCHAQITTETSFNMGYIAKMCVFTLLCSFVWVGLFCVAFWPCCSNRFKDVEHTCPRCRKVVAKYERHRIAPNYQSPWFRQRGMAGYGAAHFQAGYNQQVQPAEAPPGILIVQPKPMVTADHFKPYDTTCPHCHAQIRTETSYQVGDQALLWVFIFTCIFAWFGLVCFIFLPCCIKSFKDVTHTCPRCHQTVAVYERHEML